MPTRQYRGRYHCPSCDKSKLQQQEMHNVPLLGCPECNGVFVSVYHLAHFVGEEAMDPAAGHSFLELLDQATAQDAPGGFNLRKCVICKRKMQRFGFGEYPLSIVDRCLEHGLWLDDWDVEKIVRQSRITAQMELMEDGDFDGERDEEEAPKRRPTQVFVAALACPNCQRRYPKGTMEDDRCEDCNVALYLDE